MRQATLYKKLGRAGVVECTACAHHCAISNGFLGLCGTRLNENAVLYSLAYGRPSAVAVDPVEKKPFFHFLPGTPIYSLGVMGCNFGCEFCQNWDLSQAPKLVKAEMQTERVQLVKQLFERVPELPPEKIVAECLSKGIPSVAFTYNEPAIVTEYAVETFKLAKKKGLKTAFVTNGFESKEGLKALKGLLDAANVDLKSFSKEFYQRVCKARLEPVLETIAAMHRMGVWLEVTTLVIPGLNDSPAELRECADFIASIDEGMPWHVTAFHPDFKMTDKPPTSVSKLLEARQIGLKAGLEFVYVGNVFSEGGEDTRCPQCGETIIEREGFFVKKTSFAEEGGKPGVCPRCGFKLPGVWK